MAAAIGTTLSPANATDLTLKPVRKRNGAAERSCRAAAQRDCQCYAMQQLHGEGNLTRTESQNILRKEFM